eukprot:TRINITY_DN4971_c0_g1_i1.p1 TRINITY_DN4971_c0_g1~~TRINITY_DN4971_c0_g1_i1.p1  ORF type:complete len:464 (+),score=138.28 TRINITY_DN4971_c0_g1_i1:53-1393(+)
MTSRLSDDELAELLLDDAADADTSALLDLLAEDEDDEAAPQQTSIAAAAATAPALPDWLTEGETAAQPQAASSFDAELFSLIEGSDEEVGEHANSGAEGGGGSDEEPAVGSLEESWLQVSPVARRGGGAGGTGKTSKYNSSLDWMLECSTTPQGKQAAALLESPPTTKLTTTNLVTQTPPSTAPSLLTPQVTKKPAVQLPAKSRTPPVTLPSPPPPAKPQAAPTATRSTARPTPTARVPIGGPNGKLLGIPRKPSYVGDGFCEFEDCSVQHRKPLTKQQLKRQQERDAVLKRYQETVEEYCMALQNRLHRYQEQMRVFRSQISGELSKYREWARPELCRRALSLSLVKRQLFTLNGSILEDQIGILGNKLLDIKRILQLNRDDKSFVVYPSFFTEFKETTSWGPAIKKKQEHTQTLQRRKAAMVQAFRRKLALAAEEAKEIVRKPM